MDKTYSNSGISVNEGKSGYDLIGNHCVMSNKLIRI